MSNSEVRALCKIHLLSEQLVSDKLITGWQLDRVANGSRVYKKAGDEWFYGTDMGDGVYATNLHNLLEKVIVLEKEIREVAKENDG